jgi:hypothetical protein
MNVSVSATGTVTYQWRKGGAAVANGGSISGATTATLSINPAASGDAGSYDCVVTNACGSTTSAAAALTVVCYPNCDNSTASPILNVSDFTCFLQQYAAGTAYANCDQSTAPPVLNVSDFTCFLQKYALGCP